MILKTKQERRGIHMLQIKNNEIINSKDNKRTTLRGTNFGGWLMMEGYILGGRNIPESEFKKRFKKVNGEKALKTFEKKFRENFITEKDIERVKELGFNCVRIPFHWKIADKEIYWLERVVDWCKKHNVYCILDMHSVPGSQNGDWHSDPKKISLALFWKNKNFQKKFYQLWDKLSKRFKDEEIIAGYDVMNEPVIYDKNWSKILASVYNNVIETIRRNKDEHIIFIEGNMWATEYEFLEGIKDFYNVAVSIHFYHPTDYTFNLVHNLKYPNKDYNKEKIYNLLEKYKIISEKFKTPIYVGEFGINLRCENACYGEKEYINDVISVFEELSFHWTIWTYKTIYIHVQPTGLFIYNENPEFISRQENDFGWEKYILSWKKHSLDIIDSWNTDKFDKGVINLIK